MSLRLSRRRAAIAVVSAAAVVGTAFFSGTATAAPIAEPVSTPVPIVTPDGMLMSYIVNAKAANPGQTRLVERAVVAAGGVVVQSWPQIGVVVAHSERSAFRTDVVAAGGNAVESVGATRTVAVSEGTPEEAGASWGRGASGYQQGAKKDYNGDLPGAQAPAAAADPRENEQWDMVQIKADQAHTITDGSRSVLVGVLDSGIVPDHPDLKPNIDVPNSVNCTDAGRPDLSATGWTYSKGGVTAYHGTHVAGTIAAARNGIGIVGVAPNVRIASVKVTNYDGFIYPEYAVCGFVWAGLKHMDVTNSSYYIDPFMYYCEDQPDQYAAKEAVRRAVNWSTGQGVVHAAAAGNAATDLSNNTTDATSPDDSTPVVRTLNSGCEDIPTELDGVTTVSATTQATTLASFSNRGLGVIDVAAPGRRVLSTLPTDIAASGYGLLSGTSMASPHVAGVLALMKSAHPTWTPAQLLERLEAQADDHACAAPENNVGAACVGPTTENSYYGEGIVDAFDAVS
jgi:subtilisin family serine protease